MKNRVVLSLFLSLFLLTGCGIPTWFYISTSNARLNNNTTSFSTNIRVDTEFPVEAKFMLLYTIHNASTGTTPTISSIQSSLISDFRSRYRLSDANSNRFANDGNPVATYTNSTSQTTFNLYPFRVLESSDGSSLPSNGVGGDMDYLFRFDNTNGTIDETVTYSVTNNPDSTVTITATINEGESDQLTYTLARYDRTAFLNSSSYSSDTKNDHSSVESGSYSIYIFPVMYISSDDYNGMHFSNTMLVLSSGFLSHQL